MAASRANADWITFDVGTMLLILVAWGLGAAFTLGGVGLAAAACFTQPPSGRARRAQQAALCLALAALLGFGLPVVFEALGPAARDTLALFSLFWAPALVLVGGLLIHHTGRPR